MLDTNLMVRADDRPLEKAPDGLNGIGLEGFLEWALENGAVSLESDEEWEALKVEKGIFP